jgi:hypothetical protein
MTVLGRLWRRAPAWRVCLVTAVACTALAAMFPPAVPRWQDLSRLWAAKTGAPGPAAALGGDKGVPHYAPAPTPGPLDYSTIDSPPLGEGRTGIIPFGGRSLPLPTGAWQELVLARSGGEHPVQLAVLDRVTDGRLSGLLLVTASSPWGGAGQVGLPQACVSPEIVARHITPDRPEQEPLSHECWTLTAVSLSQLASHAANDDPLGRALSRLGQQNVPVPDTALALTFVRSSANGLMNVTLFVPARGPVSRAATRPQQDWAARYQAILHKGFDGTLKPEDLTPASIRDPGAG